jgi:hypothetical protein
MNTCKFNLEIGSQKQCRCRFRNRQPKTVSLPIQKSTAKNSVAADSEIDSQNFSAADSEFGSQKVCRCRFRNRQQ